MRLFAGGQVANACLQAMRIVDIRLTPGHKLMPYGQGGGRKIKICTQSNL